MTASRRSRGTADSTLVRQGAAPHTRAGLARSLGSLAYYHRPPRRSHDPARAVPRGPSAAGGDTGSTTGNTAHRSSAASTVRRPAELAWPLLPGLCATTPNRPPSPHGARVPPPPSCGACVPQPPIVRPHRMGHVCHRPRLAGLVCHNPQTGAPGPPAGPPRVVGPVLGRVCSRPRDSRIALAAAPEGLPAPRSRALSSGTPWGTSRPVSPSSRPSGPMGTTANAVSSRSLDPPLVLVCFSARPDVPLVYFRGGYASLAS